MYRINYHPNDFDLTTFASDLNMDLLGINTGKSQMSSSGFEVKLQQSFLGIFEFQAASTKPQHFGVLQIWNHEKGDSKAPALFYLC